MTAQERKGWRLETVLLSPCFPVISHIAYEGQSDGKPGEKQSVCWQMQIAAFILRSQHVKQIRGKLSIVTCSSSLLHFLRASPGATFSWLAVYATDRAFPGPCSELLDIKAPKP